MSCYASPSGEHEWVKWGNPGRICNHCFEKEPVQLKPYPAMDTREILLTGLVGLVGGAAGGIFIFLIFAFLRWLL